MLPTSLPKPIWLALAASLALAAPAAASGGIFCEGDSISVDVATGRVPVLYVLGAHIDIGDKSWSTGPERGDGTPFIVGQAFADDAQMLVDFTDPNMETIVVGLRLRFDGDDDWPLTGVLTAGGKSFPVQCGEG